jgi:hypothetical protein
MTRARQAKPVPIAAEPPAPSVPAVVAPRVVRMVRDASEAPDGPWTADVHPAEVAGFRAHGWREETQ